MSRGRRDVLRYLMILLASASTMTTLSVRSLLTKSSPVFLASPPEDRAVRSAIVSPDVRSFSVRMRVVSKRNVWKRHFSAADLTGHHRAEQFPACAVEAHH